MSWPSPHQTSVCYYSDPGQSVMVDSTSSALIPGNVALHPRLRHLFSPPYAAVRESHVANYFPPPAEDQLQRLIITAVWEVTLILCNYTFLSSPKMDLFNSSVKSGDVNIRADGMNPGHVAPACNYEGTLTAQCGGGGRPSRGCRAGELDGAVAVRFVWGNWRKGHQKEDRGKTWGKQTSILIIYQGCRIGKI